MRLADRYVFERSVGEGGGGGVVLVRDRLAGGARVALKRLPPGAHASLAQWLVNEFQVLARLSLPTVARVHDFGLASPDGDDPGGPFFTRAFVEGAPLDHAFRTHPARIPHLLGLLLATLRAIHGAGLVHGDLKPANIVVAPSGDTLSLIDFGLAHGALATASHTSGGTLAFLPPERRAALLAGERLASDPRADLYALCATVLVALGVTDDDASVHASLATIVHAAQRGTASDPSRRFATADDLATAMLGNHALPVMGAARVVPRPEGREHELGVLLEDVARFVRRDSNGASVLLAGARGAGRTTLLGELAWRAGLRGAQVVRIDGASDALAQLRTAAEVLGGTSAGDLVERVRSGARRTPVLVLVDDLDRADRDVVALLRALVYACEAGESLLVVATSVSTALADDLGTPRVVPIGALDALAITAICAQVFGPVEPGVVEAVQARTGGVAALVEATLVALASGGGVTAGDVEALGPIAVDVTAAWSVEQHARHAAQLERDQASPDRLVHAWTRARDPQRARVHLAAAVTQWERDGLTVVAAHALGAIDALDPDALGDALQLARIEWLVQGGEAREAIPVATRLAEARDVATGSRARLLAGRALVATGSLDAACTVLRDGLAHVLDDDVAAEMLREIALAALRSGDLAQTVARCDEALARVRSRVVRGGVLALSGLAEAYRGGHDVAATRLDEAIALVSDANAPRDEARVLAYTAIARDQAGDLAGARTLTERALERARGAGDVGQMASARLNLGGLLDRQGDLAGAMDHYRVAARLAERSARPDTALAAQLNLAGDLLRLGALSQARATLDEAVARAARLGYRESEAHGAAMLGVIATRDGDVDEGIAQIESAARSFAAIGRDDAVREATRDVVEALLARGAPGDVERAGERLATVVTDAPDDARSAMLAGWWSLLRGGDETRANERLSHAITVAGTHDEWETLATALGLRARLHAARGATLHARRDTERALEVLENTASKLPADLRGAFWGVGSRVALRATNTRDVSVADHGLSVGFNTVTMGGEPRLVLLLALAKRVGEESTLDGVLDQIVRSAVELTHAERSAVLLLEGPRGQDLAVRARSGATRDEGPDEAFSRSIAETVLLDGEPVATTNARGDVRFADYRSVHELAIGAVAAVPVRVRGRTIGVLYVENRRRRGQWSRGDVSVLEAFADHAGVAVEHARLHADLAARTTELEHARNEIAALLAERTAELETVRTSLAKAERALHGERGIVGASDGMRKLLALVERVRDGDVPVVIEGESGTGKELVARAVHDGGARAKGPFVVVHCGAIPETLLESELFGHVKGAFTGAERDRVGLLASAHGGTLLLDEVSEMPPRMQVELLRVLADRRVRPVGAEHDVAVDFRILAASNRPLADLVAAGRMREDLYYRLAVVTLRVPALRTRADDIPLLAAHLLTRIAREHGMPVRRLSRDALATLVRAPWPGNVRQLRHVLESAAVLAEGTAIERDDLAMDPVRAVSDRATNTGTHDGDAVPSGDAPTLAKRQAAERQRIVDALERVQWNKVRAAEVLGMPRRTLYRRLREYGLLE